ncbi:hypothetical protein LCGC14_1131070 [marine sediment metagenome]|uniref:Uncharacterized protein n=1 Tax=marine sediment metagenome TaxID=412755 RepID=A0A0F9M5Y7_9ZZZZ
MKIKNFGFIIFLLFISGLFMIPKTVAEIGEIGTDPNDDILQSNPSTIKDFEYWLGNFYLDEDPPHPTELFDDVNSVWFDIVDGPDSVDVVSWGISGNDLYIKVEDITDWIDTKYFSIDILIIYNTTTEFGHNDIIIWVAEIDIFEGEIYTKHYVAEFNIGLGDEAEEFGDVDIDEETNEYSLEFDSGWITETNSSNIANDMYGCVFGVQWDTTFIDDVSEYNMDMIPNSFYGQTIETTDTNVNYNQVIYISIIVFIISLLGLAFFMLYNDKKKGKKSSKKRFSWKKFKKKIKIKK